MELKALKYSLINPNCLACLVKPLVSQTSFCFITIPSLIDGLAIGKAESINSKIAINFSG